jgi:ribosomal protein L35
MKTNKSFSKRIKVTKNGKLMVRKAGQNHFNAKESGSKTLSKRNSRQVVMKAKLLSRALPGQNINKNS